MMSIFSSFDAVCAEYFGQKINSSFENPKEEGRKTDSEQKGFLRKAIDEMKRNGGKDGLSPPPPSQARNPPQKGGAPRFAVEFDGLHCYETIVSR